MRRLILCQFYITKAPSSAPVTESEGVAVGRLMGSSLHMSSAAQLIDALCCLFFQSKLCCAGYCKTLIPGQIQVFRKRCICVLCFSFRNEVLCKFHFATRKKYVHIEVNLKPLSPCTYKGHCYLIHCFSRKKRGDVTLCPQPCNLFILVGTIAAVVCIVVSVSQMFS